MWTYSGDALKRRASFSDREGFLLDYWLFLHADRTHSIWSSRPIGFSFLARFVLNLPGRVPDGFQRDLEVTAHLRQFFPTSPPQDPPIEPTKGYLSASWRGWLEQALARKFQESLVAALVERIYQALEGPVELGELSFLLRQLSAQLADDDVALHSVVSQIRTVLLGSESTHRVTRDVLASALLPGPARWYRVRFPVVPVVLPGKIAQQAKRHHTVRLVFSGESGERKELVAIQEFVEAHHPSQAVAHAIGTARGVLQRLRLGHYIRTSLHGPAEVEPTDAIEAIVRVPLPRPFGLDGGTHGHAPRVPGSFRFTARRLDEPERSRWAAATWHVSAAIGQWPEDTHAAASEVWQALESFAGGKANVMTSITRAFLRNIPRHLLSDLARAVSRQQNAFVAMGESTDWRPWKERSQPLTTWLEMVLHPASSGRFALWTRPRSPLLLYGPGVGLLQPWRSALKSGVPPMWASERLQRDLQLLYALRNAAVHSGARLGNERVAAYLGRVGLEVLFLEMTAAVARVTSAEFSDKREAIVDSDAQESDEVAVQNDLAVDAPDSPRR